LYNGAMMDASSLDKAYTYKKKDNVYIVPLIRDILKI